MKRFVGIGLVGLGLSLAMACGGDSSEGTGDTGGATAGGATAGGATAGGATAGGASGQSSGGTAGTSGGGTAGTTSGGASGDASGGDDDDGGTPSGSGACTNAADMAVLDKTSTAQLGCEGAACLTKNLDGFSIDKAKLSVCTASEAPNLKQLSAGCRACFDAISACVPSSCVSIFGADSNACFTPTLPNNDPTKCSTPPATPSADCLKCQMDNCSPAFIDCSGISM
jgi:hypothetical protein